MPHHRHGRIGLASPRGAPSPATEGHQVGRRPVAETTDARGAAPCTRGTTHGRRHDAPDAGERCPLRTPDPALEPQDEALHPHRAQWHLHHRPHPVADLRSIARTRTSARPSPAAARSCSSAPRSRPRRPSPSRRRASGCPTSTSAGSAGCSPTSSTVHKRLQRLKELEQIDFDDVAGSGMTKKELLVLRREKDKLERTLGGIRDMARHPVRGLGGRHQQGAHRRRRGPQAGHPGHRDPGLQLRSGRRGLPDPGQRRRHPRRRPADPGDRRRRRRRPGRPRQRRRRRRPVEPLAEWEAELLAAHEAEAGRRQVIAAAADAEPWPPQPRPSQPRLCRRGRRRRRPRPGLPTEAAAEPRLRPPRLPPRPRSADEPRLPPSRGCCAEAAAPEAAHRGAARRSRCAEAADAEAAAAEAAERRGCCRPGRRRRC